MGAVLGNLTIKCLPEVNKKAQFGIGCTDCYFVGVLDSPGAGEIIQIDSTTKIYIWFDDSGSMNSTLSPLQTMRSTILKNCLLQFYNNDSDLYDQNVTVSNFSSKSDSTERTFKVMNTVDASASKVINLVFQDEATPYSAERTFNSSFRTAQYNSDIAGLRSTLDNAINSSYYRGIVFRVNTSNNRYDGFRQFLETVKLGQASYSGTNGLADKSEISVISDVVAGNTPQYYADQIIAGLNTLGYSLQAC